LVLERKGKILRRGAKQRKKKSRSDVKVVKKRLSLIGTDPWHGEDVISQFILSVLNINLVGSEPPIGSEPL